MREKYSGGENEREYTDKAANEERQSRPEDYETWGHDRETTTNVKADATTVI